MQLPLVHSFAPAQVTPSAFFGTHWFEPLHQLPTAQFASVVHDVGQVTLRPLHR